jgi:Contractile injection system tube protein/LysM domain
MMEVPGGSSGGSSRAAPPFITFSWGSETTFKAACTSLTVAYKLFRPNGDPIRADVKMTLKQAAPASTASSTGANLGTNPTTRANAGHGVHMVKDGDTLPSIAYEAYGDATSWRTIADANGIENPLHLRRGRALSLPRLDD